MFGCHYLGTGVQFATRVPPSQHGAPPCPHPLPRSRTQLVRMAERATLRSRSLYPIVASYMRGYYQLWEMQEPNCGTYHAG